MSSINFGMLDELYAQPSVTASPRFLSDIWVGLEPGLFQQFVPEEENEKYKGKELDIRRDLVWQKSTVY